MKLNYLLSQQNSKYEKYPKNIISVPYKMAYTMRDRWTKEYQNQLSNMHLTNALGVLYLSYHSWRLSNLYFMQIDWHILSSSIEDDNICQSICMKYKFEMDWRNEIHHWKQTGDLIFVYKIMLEIRRFNLNNYPFINKICWAI